MSFIAHPTLKNSFYWKLNKNDWFIPDKPIELTVALPLKNMKQIVILALESLKNQTNIIFNWELIIWDDNNDSFDIIKQYIGTFPGCVLILYRNINPITDSIYNNNKMLLIDKWIGMAKVSSKSSKIFVLFAGDDYSSPNRLHIHYQHFKNPSCLLSTQIKSIFINLNNTHFENFNDRLLLYDGLTIDPNMTSNHPFMAYPTKLVRRVKSINQYSRIDNYLFKSIVGNNRNNKTILDSSTIDPDNWKFGFNTDGFNQISKTRNRFWYNIKPPFRKINHNIKSNIPEYTNLQQYIPDYIIQFLHQLINT